MTTANSGAAIHRQQIAFAVPGTDVAPALRRLSRRLALSSTAVLLRLATFEYLQRQAHQLQAAGLGDDLELVLEGLHSSRFEDQFVVGRSSPEAGR